MKHKPSTYTGNITLTVQQMMEVHKAIRARIVHLTIEADDYPHKHQDIQELLTVGELLNHHETQAVQQWEEQVARTEAQELDNETKLHKFLDGN
jgi:hypothetical protein